MSDWAVELKDVRFSYEDVSVLESIDLTVPSGEFLGIIGPNGSGKTTLLRLLLGFLEPDAGVVSVFGRPPRAARKEMGYVPQSTDFDRDFPISALEVVLMGRLGLSPTWFGYTRKDIEAARAALRSVEADNLRHRKFGTLSGGQRQRVLIARALASQPRLLLLDEPTANVDTRIEQDIYELLRKLNQQCTILLVTHDLGFISSYVTRVACLNRTLICHPTARITADDIDQLYQGPVHLVHHHQVAPPESHYD